MSDFLTTEPVPTKRRPYLFIGGGVLLTLLVVLGATVSWLMSPPTAFSNTGYGSVTIPEGASVEAIATEVANSGLVRSRLLLYVTLVALHDHKTIYAGTYTFSQPTNVFGIAKKLIDHQIEVHLVRLTIPEGLRVNEVAALVHHALPEIPTAAYIAQASSSEGYLFPDTYLVPPTFTAAKLVKLQRANFNKHLLPFKPAIASSSLSEAQVITLASLLEREANSTTSMRMVAGILENRLKANMPLQVDATISYALGTPQKPLSVKDLKVDSPYNTYLHTGLPPTPIDSPGLQAIHAVLEPIVSDNYYYLTDANGVFHYAKTLAEHNRNVAHYLK